MGMSKRYEAYYDDFNMLWTVREIKTGIMYPMTEEPMANEMSNLLNKYDERIHNILDELFKKDRKFESLGYDLDELDRELGIKGF